METKEIESKINEAISGEKVSFRLAFELTVGLSRYDPKDFYVEFFAKGKILDPPKSSDKSSMHFLISKERDEEIHLYHTSIADFVSLIPCFEKFEYAP